MTGLASAGAWVVASERSLPFGGEGGPLLMAIVNVTPDSFSDGGNLLEPGAAADAALRAADEGAAIIDIGGESTRPGAAPVAAQEQIRRVIPVVRSIRGRRHAAISIDTTSAEVAAAAIDAGADIINDTSAGIDDERMLALAAERRCGLVLMHRPTRPAAEIWSHEHRDERAVRPGVARSNAPDDEPATGSVGARAIADSDVVRRVRDELAARVSAALEAGVARERIAVDPGLGFGKSVTGNFELLARLDEITAIGYPVLVGASRKSFIGAAAGVDRPRDRTPGSLAAAMAAAMRGAAILRVHDVPAHRQALAVLRRCLHPAAPSPPEAMHAGTAAMADRGARGSTGA